MPASLCPLAALLAQLPDNLDRALLLCVRVHNGQVDQAGMPYYLHPLRMSMRLTDPTDCMVALLHDIVEDHGLEWSFERLGIWFPAMVVDAVAILTHQPLESYAEYLTNIKHTGGCALRVKLADLADNLDSERLALLPDATAARLCKRYLWAQEYLLAP